MLLYTRETCDRTLDSVWWHPYTMVLGRSRQTIVATLLRPTCESESGGLSLFWFFIPSLTPLLSSFSHEERVSDFERLDRHD